MNQRLLFILGVCFLLSSCVEEAKKVVEVNLGKYLEPVSLTVTPGEDLGEIIVEDTQTLVKVKIRNNSSETIRNINLSIDPSQKTLVFKEDEIPDPIPSCKNELKSKEECLYVLSFSHNIAGEYAIPITFNYENLISAAQKKFMVKALIGEGAALVFTNDIVKYDLGVVEQTEPLERFLDLEIQNKGDLIARDIFYTLTNSNNEDSFSLSENNCPKRLRPLEKCRLKIRYVPKNNNYSDPEKNYISRLAISYYKDTLNRVIRLNGSFSFRSSTIEAKFESSYPVVNFKTLVTGNQEAKIIKITNKGYNTGYLKKLIFHNELGETVATCSKVGTQELLNCTGRADFPFVVEDLGNCIDAPLKGWGVAGESCNLRVTYWPKRSYAPGSQAEHNYNKSKISLVYDSRWLNQEKIITKSNVLTVNATFTVSGLLGLVEITQEGIRLPESAIQSINKNLVEVNIGRVAKTADPLYSTQMLYKFKNFGETPVGLVSIKDGATPANIILDLATNLNSYYQGAKHVACNYVPPGGTCTLSFLLTPLVQGDSSLEENLMFDDVTNPLKKFKSFKFEYDDGSRLNDDGSIATNALFEVKMIAELISKGVLAFEYKSIVLPSLINGLTYTKIINIANLGTADVTAVSYDDVYKLSPEPGNPGRNWPFRIVPLGTVPLPATKDCYNILYPTGSPLLTDIPDPNRKISPGESCALGIEIKASNLNRWSNGTFTIDTNHTRIFNASLNNTTEIQPRASSSFSGKKLVFKYRDGDINNEDIVSSPFGYLQTMKDLSLSLSVQAPSYLILKDPYPTTSALIVRPAITAPLISVTYPVVGSLPAYTVPKAFFESKYFTKKSHAFTSSQFSYLNYNSLGRTDTDFVFHMGTFPVGGIYDAGFSFAAQGPLNIREALLIDEGIAGYPIQISEFNNTVSPFPLMNLVTGVSVPVKFKFSPTGGGLYQRCFRVEYNNEIGGIGYQRVCVLAQAVVTYPKFKIEVQDYTVTQDPVTGSVSAVPTGLWSTLSSPLNSVDLSSAGLASFAAMRESSIYALKRFRFTNNGTATAKKFNYSFLTAKDTPGTPITDFKLNATNCTGNMTLAVGQSCYVEYKYTSTISSPALYSSLGGLTYEIAADKNQFVSQSFRMEAIAQEPAAVVMNKVGVSVASITSWAGTNPLAIPKSWPVDLGTYSDSTSNHMVLGLVPTTKSILGVPFKNTSLEKASFLVMNPSPSAAAWNDIYSDANLRIEANRYCFYGDDELNGAIPAFEKGFNSSSINICKMNFYFYGDVSYQTCNKVTKTKVVMMGGKIQDGCNPYVYQLNYYSYKRSALSKVYVHIKGFIEPNRVLPETASYSQVNVQTSETSGNVSFSWDTFDPQNINWGDLKNYRVYYSTSFNDLKHSNLFYKFDASPVLSFIDTTSASVTITGLNQGKYYFFRVVAVRTYNHPIWGNLDYISLPTRSAFPILVVPIPTSEMIYNHETKKLIDKNYIASPGSRSEGLTICGAQKYTLNIAGTAKTFPKGLIDSQDWLYLRSNSEASSGYPLNDVATVNHWLSDNSYNLNGILTLGDGTVLSKYPEYNPFNMTGVNSENKLLYKKECNDQASCDFLYKMVGGDGYDLFYDGTTYTFNNGIPGFYRCASVILCPTNTVKKITDPSCAAP